MYQEPIFMPIMVHAAILFQEIFQAHVEQALKQILQEDKKIEENSVLALEYHFLFYFS